MAVPACSRATNPARPNLNARLSRLPRSSPSDIDGRELAVELAKPPQPKEKKVRPKKAPAAGRAPRAEDAVDGEEETAAAAAADGEAKPKAKRTVRSLSLASIHPPFLLMPRR